MFVTCLFDCARMYQFHYCVVCFFLLQFDYYLISNLLNSIFVSVPCFVSCSCFVGYWVSFCPCLSLSHFVLRHSAFVHLLAAVKIRRNRFIRNASKCAIFPFILYCFWLQAEFLVLLFFSRTTHFRLFILWCKVNYRFCFNPHYSGSITPSSFCLDYQQ